MKKTHGNCADFRKWGQFAVSAKRRFCGTCCRTMKTRGANGKACEHWRPNLATKHQEMGSIE